MKIMAIRGKNLASLEGEFEIDFTDEPLRSTGIFAITGQTGAGKSTLLDALCLALFDDSPRLNKAESSVNVSDVEDKTITQKDSRTILRRGTSEGFAEVDFVALNGDRYRARWMVRRARGKTGGALQPATLRLENLSSATEEQGTKKNILDRIVELIGLTFDQFTRAVLLAQGDFANFLKAKQNEKAELLEKLTGTEVYSRISARIYQRTEEARQALSLILQRMQDVKLLTEEERTALNQEKNDLEKEEEPLKKELTRIEKCLDWLRQQTRLEAEATQAGESLKAIQEAIVQAAPRYEYLAMIDLTQGIREVYWDRQGKRAQHEKLLLSLQQHELQLKELSDGTAKSEVLLDTSKQALEEAQQDYARLKPDIDKAKELDFRLSSVQEKSAEATKELDAANKQFTVEEQQIAKLKEQDDSIKKDTAALNQWFADHAAYQEMVVKIDLIVNHLKTAHSSRQQERNTREALASGQGLLEADLRQLKALEERAEQLNELFPSEVIALRNKLEDGAPCPVCGSLHHPFSTGENLSQSLNEKELERAKKKNAEEAAKVKERIEQTRTNITAFTSYIENYQKQFDEVCAELKTLLLPLPGWENRIGEEAFPAELKSIASQWNRNKELTDTYRQQQANIETKREAGNRALQAQQEARNERAAALSVIRDSYQKLLEERKALLDNKPAAEVEKQRLSLIERLSKRYEQERKQKEELDKRLAGLTGTIGQLRKDQAALEMQVEQLDIRVRDWLSDNQHALAAGLLDELMARPKEWIDRERASLHEWKDQELVAKTTLAERKARFEEHQQSEYKPGAEQTQESLSLSQSELDGKTKSIRNRLTEIQVALLAHDKGKEQVKTFEKEKNEKQALYDNWAKLNDLLGSASGNKFKTIAQGYTLDVLLGYANKHLEELATRYKLEKIPGTLALQVIDNDMLGEVRSVHSLSGGESFLISLALALGLSSLSSNRMKIESLFIDEGFGALDIDTLSIAVDALDKLQTQGRKIGVISHVEEMKERITTQIQVLKSANGRSYIRVVG